jgi:SagB-type dehydrogenase family enzyme
VTPEPDEGTLVVENLDTLETHRIDDPQLLTLLDRAADWTRRSTLVSFLTESFGVRTETAESTIADLLDRQFLVTPETHDEEIAEQADHWADRGWKEAFRYYLTVHDYPFADYREDGDRVDADRMETYTAESSPPGPYKRYGDVPTVELPEPEPTNVSVGDGLGLPGFGASDRRPEIDPALLARLLKYTFGAFGTKEPDNEGQLLLKTSPSCGARHPTEGYVAVFDVDGVEPGVYHYGVEQHRLELVAATDVTETIERAVPEVPAHDATFSFVVFFTSVLERSMWRYRQSRAYTQLHHDVGHVVETLRMLAKAEGLDFHYNQGFDDDELYSYLGLNRYAEPVFAYLACGLHD